MMSRISKKQAGVSLMLAVLILAAITAIAFSLSSIVFIELRSSGDEIRTEPNLYASFGVTEEALYQYKRFVPATSMDVVNCTAQITNVCRINNVSLSLPNVNGQPQPIQYDDTPTVKVVAAGSKIELPMYQTNNFNKQYGKIQVDIMPGATNSLKVSFRKTDSAGVVTNYGPFSVSTGTPFTFSSFDPTGQYDLILDNTTAGNKDLSAVLSTYDTNGTTAKGLPFIGQNVLKIVANYLGLTRTYRVQIPLAGGSSGTPISNVALASAGAVAEGYYSSGASGNDNLPNFPPASAINGDRTGAGWGSGTGGWNDNWGDTTPNWLQVNFASAKTIDEIDVFTLADSYPITPTPTTSAASYGIQDFQVQYWNGSAWTTVPGGSITGNTLAWNKVSFSSVTTDKIRVYITANRAGFSRVVELEAYGY